MNKQMIEKLEPHKILPQWQHNNGGITEAPPTNWELMAKINEIIEYINEMENDHKRNGTNRAV